MGFTDTKVLENRRRWHGCSRGQYPEHNCGGSFQVGGLVVFTKLVDVGETKDEGYGPFAGRHTA